MNNVWESFKQNLIGNLVSRGSLVLAAFLGAVVAYVFGALAFQYTASGRLTYVEAQIVQIQSEQIDTKELAVITQATLAGLTLQTEGIDKRLDRMENKMDQILLDR